MLNIYLQSVLLQCSAGLLFFFFNMRILNKYKKPPAGTVSDTEVPSLRALAELCCPLAY